MAKNGKCYCSGPCSRFLRPHLLYQESKANVVFHIDGQWRRLFHVVIAGSNAYNKNGVPESPGYSPIQSLGEAAINAERDCNGVDTYMTYKLFTNTPFDPRLCAAACDAETAYAVAHPPATGPVRKCNFWNTYLLARNGEAQGQYCSLYTEPHGAQFATNRGMVNSDPERPVFQLLLATRFEDCFFLHSNASKI